MKKTAFQQLVECFRNSADTDEAAYERSLQLIAWAHLSARLAIPAEYSLTVAQSVDDNRLHDVLNRLANISDLHRDAFETLARARLEPSLRGAMALCAKFLIQGLLGDHSMVSDEMSGSGHRPSFGVAPRLADFFVALALQGNPKTAYVAWDQAGQLTERIISQDDVAVHCDIPVRAPMTSLLALISGKSLGIGYGDPIRSPVAVQDGRLTRFDVALASPPIGQRYDDDVVRQDLFGRFQSQASLGRNPSGTVLWIRHLLAVATDRVVVMVPNSMLFRTFAEGQLRRELIENGQVETVIALPSGLHRNTMLATSILVLRPRGGCEHVRFVNVAEPPEVSRSAKRSRVDLPTVAELLSLVNGQGRQAESIDVAIAEIRAAEYQLQPSRYLASESLANAEKALACMRRVALGEIVETIRPVVSRPGNGRSIDVREVSIADVGRGPFIGEPEKIVALDHDSRGRVAHQCLKPFDIVLTIKGTVGRVGLVPLSAGSDDRPWIVGQSSIALRITDRNQLDPRVLFTFLRSDIGQQLMMATVAGAAIQLIQVRELTVLAVPIPPKDQAQRIIDRFNKEASLQAEIDRLTKEQALLATAPWA